MASVYVQGGAPQQHGKVGKIQQTHANTRSCTTLFSLLRPPSPNEIFCCKLWERRVVKGGEIKKKLCFHFSRTSVRGREIFPRRAWTQHYLAPSHWCVLRSLIQNQRRFTATNCPPERRELCLPSPPKLHTQTPAHNPLWSKYSPIGCPLFLTL